MEKTIVQFIVENILIFLPIGVTGVIATIVLFILPKKKMSEPSLDTKADVLRFFHIRFNFYVGVYLFVWIMMVIIGVLSDFLVPTIIGGIVAAIPLLLIMFFEYKTKNAKVS
jgi:hypothetical protein